MKLDVDKKYRFAGLMFSGTHMGWWYGRDEDGDTKMALKHHEFAYQLEQGNAVEVREPREFKTTGILSLLDHKRNKYTINLNDLAPEWAHGEVVEVTIREVLK